MIGGLKCAKTGDILLKLGITPDLSGFNYIIDMVEMINNGEVSKMMTAYSDIAQKRGHTAYGVERGIRQAIRRVNAESEEYERYIGANIAKESNGGMANSAFLYTLAYRVKEE